MEINMNKSRTMIIANEEKKHKIIINGKILEQFKEQQFKQIFRNDNRIQRKSEPRYNRKDRNGGRSYNTLKNTFFGKKEIPRDIKI